MSSKTDTILSAWSAFFVAHALSIQRIEAQLQGVAPLSLMEYDVLLNVVRAPQQRVRYSELVARSVFSKSGITRLAKRLEERKFIRREVCQEDRRGAFVVLTEDGEDALRSTWQHYSQEILALFTPAFTIAEAKELERLMEKIINQLRPDPLVVITRAGERSEGRN